MGWDLSKSTIVLPQIILLTIVVFSLTFSFAVADHSPRNEINILPGGTISSIQSFQHIDTHMVLENLSNEDHWIASRDGSIESG